MFEKFKNALSMVDTVHKSVDAVVWLAGIVLPFFVVNSATMRYWLIGGGVLGGIIGFYVTTSRWRGSKRSACLKGGLLHAFAGLIALGGLAFLLAVLKTEVASISTTLITIRELLLRAEFAPNLLGSLLAGATIWLLVAAVTLHSKQLCE